MGSEENIKIFKWKRHRMPSDNKGTVKIHTREKNMYNLTVLFNVEM